MIPEKNTQKSAHIQSLSESIQAELDRLFPSSQVSDFIFFNFTTNLNVFIFNSHKSLICFPLTLLKRLKNTESASLNDFSPNNIWNIIASCSL